ncbi:hypothetical protein Tco_1032489 [Tanacetum coccineum]|uniref:Histone deacetylase 14 n=1 Tax=Tanacetum coccineum TaxID=301880 RepID=A0ABQ5GD18_9ASTR
MALKAYADADHAGCQDTRRNTMADVNVNASAEQAPAMAPPTHTDDQILPRSSWVPGVVNRAHIDYAERMWEEFTQSINSFIEDKKNLALHTQGKKKANPIMIPSIRFTKLIIHHLQSKHKFHPRPGSPLHLPYEEYVLGYLKFSAKGTKREVFRMPILNELITADIRGGQYYNAYLEKVAKHQRYLAGEESSDPDSPAPKPDKVTKAKETKKSKPSAPKAAPITELAAAKASKSTSSQQPKPKPAPAKPQEKKRKLVKETSDESSPAKISKRGLVTKRRKPTSSLRLVDEFIDEGIPENEPSLDPMDEGFIATTYPNVQENLKLAFINDKPFEAENEKITAETEAESMVSVTIQQDSSAIPPMTSPVIDLISRPDSPNRISELEQIMANLIHDKSQLEERDRFRDFPEADMKDILHQRMWETNSCKAHEDHKKLYEALEKSMDRDHTDQLLTDLAKAQRKKKRRHDSPKTPPGSPSYQPPPPPPLAVAPSSSKTPASAEYTAWMTIDTRLKPFVHSSDDENIRNDHIPKVNLMQDWWKPLSEDDIPATPEPAWSILSSDLPVPINKWSYALASTYAPPSKNSLLAQTGDMAIFMD